MQIAWSMNKFAKMIVLYILQSTRQIQSGIYAQPKHLTKVSSFRNASPSEYFNCRIGS